jgi:hypothetical protein
MKTSKDKTKEHDSVMNSLDFSLSCSTDMSWLELANTQQYHVISKAVWDLVHGITTPFEEEDE